MTLTERLDAIAKAIAELKEINARKRAEIERCRRECLAMVHPQNEAT